MFQLIISIFAVILGVALTGMAVFYGGAALSSGSDSAKYATLSNQASQIEGAATLFRAQEGASIQSFIGQTGAANDFGLPTSGTLTSADALGALVNKEYLKQVPDNTWKIDVTVPAAPVLYKADVPSAVCDTDPSFEGQTAVADTASAVTEFNALTGNEAKLFGCIEATTGGNVFLYKL